MIGHTNKQTPNQISLRFNKTNYILMISDWVLHSFAWKKS